LKGSTIGEKNVNSIINPRLIWSPLYRGKTSLRRRWPSAYNMELDQKEKRQAIPLLH
jgi:hypothetical protein